ncbi:polyprenyl synthetase family protein [Corynebacterium auriscanis]|uniref:Geranylgeranyl pyrophosphate synthase n=1 Tax=Corynebacterium auriscanis TaxID=99807 RepID=A0A0A2DI35_9CORY|nr:polyprenyl synthetase family protein [Corynebacterium auriscanis]KGM18843.1 geranylgeranyl pyrophosphate synthase [Corynebacterium auriscanis]WJY73602.1 Heptaprenyl diphosphate synthase component 2 [Corynebacterium auriscanis]
MASTENAAVKSTPVAPQLGSPGLNEMLQARVEVAEKLLRESLMEGEPFLTDKINHLAIAGGKRFRVVFTLLSALYGEKPTADEVYKAAVVVELTHLATLYHDDVMDEADRRRGADSANMRWGNSIAILAGDYLFAVASDMLADLGAATVSHFASTFRELVTGQMRETVGCAEGQDPIEHYMTVIQEKTGVLIAAAGFLGAEHSGAPVEVRDALHAFGRNMGQVFQIVDDIIDIWSDPEESGKVPGTDLREGVFTLPVLYAMRQDDEVGARLREILTGPVEDDALVEEALELIKRSEGRERAQEQVQIYRDRAEAELGKLPESEATSALRELLGFALKRLG